MDGSDKRTTLERITAVNIFIVMASDELVVTNDPKVFGLNHVATKKKKINSFFQKSFFFPSLYHKTNCGKLESLSLSATSTLV
jgi:hypothetical protein